MAGRTFRFHPAAEAELSEAAEWYESRRPGLGSEFVRTVRNKVADILDAPDRVPISRGVRRALIAKFPYALAIAKWQKTRLNSSRSPISSGDPSIGRIDEIAVQLRRCRWRASNRGVVVRLP